jgi:hypothetical protein
LGMPLLFAFSSEEIVFLSVAFFVFTGISYFLLRDKREKGIKRIECFYSCWFFYLCYFFMSQSALLLLIFCCVAFRSSFGNSYYHISTFTTITTIHSNSAFQNVAPMGLNEQQQLMILLLPEFRSSGAMKTLVFMTTLAQCSIEF